MTESSSKLSFRQPPPPWGTCTLGLFPSQEKNMLASHTWFLCTAFLAFLQKRQKKSPGMSLLLMDLNLEKRVHSHCHAHEMWTLSFPPHPGSGRQ